MQIISPEVLVDRLGLVGHAKPRLRHIEQDQSVARRLGVLGLPHANFRLSTVQLGRSHVVPTSQPRALWHQPLSNVGSQDDTSARTSADGLWMMGITCGLRQPRCGARVHPGVTLSGVLPCRTAMPSSLIWFRKVRSTSWRSRPSQATFTTLSNTRTATASTSVCGVWHQRTTRLPCRALGEGESTAIRGARHPTQLFRASTRLGASKLSRARRAHKEVGTVLAFQGLTHRKGVAS